MNGALFNPDETYTELGNQLSEEAGKIADDFFARYPDSPTRDVVKIIYDRIDMEGVFLRVTRQIEKAKQNQER